MVGCVASLLAMVNVPDCGRAEAGGMKWMGTWTEAPAATGKSGDIKTMNTKLDRVRLVTLKGAFPVLDTVRSSVTDVPIITEPKFSEAGETLILGAGGAVPVPDNET